MSPRSFVQLQNSLPLESHKLWRIIQEMIDAVIVFTPEGKILMCNPSFEEIIHQSQEIILHKTLHELFGNLAPELAEALTKPITNGEAFSYELTLDSHHQPRIYHINIVPIDEAGQVTEAMAVFHDVTDVKQTEKMRRDFVANVSHELRTPLSAIRGYAETLLDGALQDEAVAQEFVQIIFNHSTRLSQLVRDLLDLSKIESPDFQVDLSPIDIVSSIHRVIDLHQGLLQEKKIQLHCNLPPSFPKVLVNEGNLEQVLTNLLDNAIKYTITEGTITIRLTEVDGFAQVDIEDTGMGIEAKHIPRLFERFYRVDKARSRDLGGTGLGLSIVKHIIQYHGGKVWVESTPGQGSRFSFTLQITE